MFLVLGMIVCSTAHTMNTFIAGMALSGVGAGVNELTALAATSEMAPTSQRGKYVSVLIFTIIPFCPSVLWGQLIASHSTWRWIGLFCGVWAFIGLVMTAVFYFPPPRPNSQGLTRREIINQIDFVGGLLSIAGMLLFMMGLQVSAMQKPPYEANPITVGRLPVRLGFCSCPCTPSHWWHHASHIIPSLGDLWREVSDVPKPFKERSANYGPHIGHYLHLRRELLLSTTLLAHTSIQRLRP